MLEIEEEVYKLGYNHIACIDEVGRGCLAGDVLACAIIMPRGLKIEGVNDSKKLSEKKRNLLYNIILEKSVAVGIGRVSSQIIDKINIKQATILAMEKAVDELKDKDGKKISPDFLLIDAEIINKSIASKSIIKGDQNSHGIACASIIAKVYRDNLCRDWDELYKGYNLKKHKGYGTKEHREYILELGPSPIHRISFLKKILNK